MLPFFLSSLLATGQVSVTTYHYDNNRSGWNSQESALTPAKVNSSSFKLLHKVTLDDQVDGQPLLVPGVNITAGNYQGKHDVAYIASEGNTIYAIDAESGQILLSPNLGTPVPSPLGCNNNGPNVGVNSTPVIDLGSNTLYVIAYTDDAAGPTYRIHALDLGSLTDKVTPVVVAASHTLINGTAYTFNGKYQRQRPALLLANGNIYAGFGSFCDFSASQSRGWLLGWSTGSLTPLPANQLFDTQAQSPNNFFLSSIWMSGYGLSADDSGNVVFVTGNSDNSGTTYDGITNIQESVIKISSNLTTVQDLFTPKNQPTLDQKDEDFGSGGALVLPDQPGSVPHLAVAAGKAGVLFLMNEDHLGGYSTTKNNVLGSYGIGACWCGQSYYIDPTDGVARIVSSGGRNVRVWRLNTSGASPSLTDIANGAVPGGQFPGFFTSISSNGQANPIIWALSRPPNSSPNQPIVLYAFNPDSVSGTTMQLLVKTVAGNWPNLNGDANLVPVVANGKVYVASNKQLRIFGLVGGKAK